MDRLFIGLAGLDLGNLRLEVAVGGEQVEASIQVIVEEEEAEFERRLGRGTEPVQVGQVRELEHRRLVAHIQGRHLVREVADGQPQSLVVLELSPVDTHTASGRTRLVEGHSRHDRDLFELPATFVVEQEILDRVVGHGDVDEAIAVDVIGGHAQRFPHRHLQIGRADLDSGRLADVRESPSVVTQEGARTNH